MISFTVLYLKACTSFDLVKTLPHVNERAYVFITGKTVLIMTPHFEPHKLSS